MFGKSITLFELLGFKVRINASWIVIAVLLTWSLATGYFRFALPAYPPGIHWLMGIAGTLGLFMSIILHELGHAVIARRDGLRIRGITLFIFGGVAEMESEPPTPKAELRMAIAGPIVSVALSILFLGLYYAGAAAGWSVMALSVSQYLGFINGIMVLFNMIPAFPLDGGRVLRSILWARRGDLPSATRTAAGIGSGFGTFLIFLGLFSVLWGNVVGGIWWFLLGMFLRGASMMSYQQEEIRRYLEGEPVSKFMTRDPITVPSTISVDELVHDYFYRYHMDHFPVVSGDKLIGSVGTREIKNITRNDWPRTAVFEVFTPCSAEDSISSRLDAVKALSHMSKKGHSSLMVAERDRLVGVLSLRDLLTFLAIKLDLEGGADHPKIDVDEKVRELQGV